MKMIQPKIHCISIPRALLKGGPPDLQEQIENLDRVRFGDMSTEAVNVFAQAWDPIADGLPWPPPKDHHLIGFIE